MYRILIAEDEGKLREVLGDYFGRLNYEVDLAVDGEEAKAFLAENNYDLAILDIMMPKADGFEICEKIRESSDIPVIFLTARTAEEDQLRGFQAKADDYVTKPFSLPVLSARAESLYEYYMLTAIVIIVLTALLISEISRLIEDRFESEHRRRLMADATAHDMKTPLSIIRNYAELILYEASGEKSSRYARNIIEESDSMNNTVVNMLDLSKMEAGTYPMDLSYFNLSELMKKDIERHRALIEEKNLQLQGKLPENIFVFADQKLMSMAFSNYLSNGIKHAEEGTVLTVSLEKIRNRVRISVHNVGQPVYRAVWCFIFLHLFSWLRTMY